MLLIYCFFHLFFNDFLKEPMYSKMFGDQCCITEILPILEEEGDCCNKITKALEYINQHMNRDPSEVRWEEDYDVDWMGGGNGGRKFEEAKRDGKFIDLTADAIDGEKKAIKKLKKKISKIKNKKQRMEKGLWLQKGLDLLAKLKEDDHKKLNETSKNEKAEEKDKNDRGGWANALGSFSSLSGSLSGSTGSGSISTSSKAWFGDAADGGETSTQIFKLVTNMFPIVKDWPLFQTGSLASLGNLSEVAGSTGMLPQVLGPLVFLLGKASGADSKTLKLFLKKINQEAQFPKSAAAQKAKTSIEEKAFANEANINMRNALDSTKGSEKTLEQIGEEAVDAALKNQALTGNETAQKIQKKLAKEAREAGRRNIPID